MPAKILRHLFILFVAVFLVSQTVPAQTTAFTYQGKLTDNGNLANGSYDLQFKLFDTATVGTGTQQGSAVTVSNVTVTNGIFTVQLDFGVCASCFNGAARFLEIAVRPIGGGSFTTLSPRQSITSTPYALKTSNLMFNGAYNDGAGTVFTASNTFAGDGAGVNTTPSGTLNDVVGKLNSFYGAGAGQANTNGFSNTFFGTQAGQQNTTASNNAFFGYLAGQRNTTGSPNAFFGALAGLQNTTGQFNAFFGTQAGQQNTTGLENAFFGTQAGFSNTTGFNNAFFGTSAGSSNITGSGNTFIGGGANFNDSNFTGNNLTLLGSSSLAFANVSNATAVGANAAVIQDNSLVLGSINGINGATADTNVGIGTPTPSERLHVVGNTVIIGNVGVGTTAPRSALEVVRNWNGSFGALTVTGDRPTIRFSGGSPANNDQWILHLGSMAGTAPAGSLSFFFGGTAGTSYGNPVLSVTPTGTVIIGGLSAAGSTSLCRNANNEIATCSSSLRYKTDVSAFTGGLDVVKQLRPIYFTWKQGGMRDVGFAAEEVAKVEPLFTFTNDQGQVEGVKYDRLNVVLVNAVKEQQQQIEVQQSQTQTLQRQVSQQRQLIEQQQKQLEALKRLVCKSNPDEEICKP